MLKEIKQNERFIQIYNAALIYCWFRRALNEQISEPGFKHISVRNLFFFFSFYTTSSN